VSTMLLAFEAGNPKDTFYAVLQIAKDSYVPETEIENSTKKKNVWKRHILRYLLVLLIGVLMKHYNVVETKTRRLILPPPSTITESLVMIPPSSFTSIAQMSIYWSIRGMILFMIWMISNGVLNSIIRLIANPRHGEFVIPTRVDGRIQPDYEKDTVDVFAGFVEYCVEISSRLDILCRHWAPDPANEHGRKLEMPSWILPLEGHAFGGPGHRSLVNADSLVSGDDGRLYYTASGTVPLVATFGKTGSTVYTRKRTKNKASGTYVDPTFQQRSEVPRQFDGTLSVKGFVFGTVKDSVPLMDGLISRLALEILSGG
jgi:hypothetical protein